MAALFPEADLKQNIPFLRIPLGEGSRGPIEVPAALLRDLHQLAQLTHGTRFPPSAPRAQGLIHPWLSACHHRQASAVFSLHCQHHRISLSVGETQAQNIRAVLGQIRANSPMVRAVQVATTALHEQLEKFTARTHLFGHPRPPERLGDSSPHGLVLRAFQEYSWCLLIRLEPVPLPEVNHLANSLTGALTRVSQNSDQDATQKLLGDLLGNWMERLQVAKYEGLWNPRMQVFAMHQGLADEVAAAYASVLGFSPLFPMRIGRATPEVANWQAPNAPHFTRDTVWPRRDGLLTSEASWLGELPHEEYEGHTLLPECRFGVAPAAKVDAAAPPSRFTIGHVLDRHLPTYRPLEIEVDQLSRHGLITGLTGSGKTTTCRRLLESLRQYREDVPFLVIEPAKNEYQRWFETLPAESYHVFGIDDREVAPLQLNPFVPSVGFPLQGHIDFICQLFQASFNFWGPQIHMLFKAIHQAYHQVGWHLDSGRFISELDGVVRYPSFDDLLVAVKKVVHDEKNGYKGELARNIEAAILGRLERLQSSGGKKATYSPSASVPEQVLFAMPCLIRLTGAVSDDEKAFLMGLIFIRLYEYHEVNSQGQEGTLKHLTLIEEAHRLFRRTTGGTSGDDANPRALSIELFSNLLAEIRAYGEGILLAEQIPQKLVSDAIKNTNLKITHRLVHREDRELIGQAINLSPEQMQELALLKTGEAVVHFQGLTSAVHIAVERGAAPRDKTPPPTQKALPAEAICRIVHFQARRATPVDIPSDAPAAEFWTWLRTTATTTSIDPASFTQRLRRALLTPDSSGSFLTQLWRLIARANNRRSADRDRLADEVTSVAVHALGSGGAVSAASLRILQETLVRSEKANISEG